MRAARSSRLDATMAGKESVNAVLAGFRRRQAEMAQVLIDGANEREAKKAAGECAARWRRRSGPTAAWPTALPRGPC